ncbi:MAG TPA: nicotinate-nucleotide adenylyltransferase [Pyrinomonadaceae bacterium]|nr:nicotinate-nucleotide adenylyltransferase [Pyrinomonadaceae bacterium]
MDQRKRLAIYGGTFDPVHLGHLQIARSVSEIFAIDQFLFMPALIAPHKIDREVSSPLHRYAMLALATQHDPRLTVSTYEIEGRERQYTVDTLEHFVSELRDEADLFFVMGLDSWTELTTWREWRRLPTLANLIVVTRPGFEFSEQQLESGMAAMVVDVRGRSHEVPSTLGTREKRIFITDVVQLDISATVVREMARNNQNDELQKLVPREVGYYIRKYGLYRN